MKEAGEASAQCTETEHVAEPTQSSSDDEDYDPEADEVVSWDDYVDDLYVEEEVVPHDGVTRTMSSSVKEAIVLPPSRQIILEFNVELQPIGQKEARNHLFHKVYDEEESFEENAKRKPSGIDAQQWRWFLNYRLKESTKKTYRQNALNRSKQLYTHIGALRQRQG
ncbi:hypothetical protein AHAS_Ahas04G0143600 [Arachis hypogaea]